MRSAGSVWLLELKLCCELHFIAAEHGRYGLMKDCGVSNAEYLVRIESLVVCISW